MIRAAPRATWALRSLNFLGNDHRSVRARADDMVGGRDDFSSLCYRWRPPSRRAEPAAALRDRRQGPLAMWWMCCLPSGRAERGSRRQRAFRSCARTGARAASPAGALLPPRLEPARLFVGRRLANAWWMSLPLRAACHQGERNEARAADVRSARAHGPGLAQLRLLVRSCRRRLEVARLYSLSLALSLALFTKPGSIH